MWLINVESRKLKCFNDDRSLPQYAILSHTWSSSEISMQEYRDSIIDDSVRSQYIRQTEGYVKIDRSCRQAHADGLTWCWVDTCCVDKTSSAELSEAINSMFRWYQGARICYVYLEDFTFNGNAACEQPSIGPNRWDPWGRLVIESNGQHRVEEGRLAKAKWFTRGWTLQELIAPTHMVFYDCTWKPFGTKSSLKEEISQITSIDLDVLVGSKNLKSICVAERMAWAAGRITTKEEDLAYSLFGIFGVNMPLLYGEGAKAFVRLQEEILKEHDDMSLFAWQPDRSPFYSESGRMAWWRYYPPNKLHVESNSTCVSIFASDPKEFSTVPAFRSPHCYTLAGEHSMVGGKGLKIELPLFKVVNPQSELLHVAIIEGVGSDSHRLASEKSSYGNLMGVLLLRLSEGHFVRHPRAPLVRVPAEDVRGTDLQMIYIRKGTAPYKPVPSPFVKRHRIRAIRAEWYDPLLRSS